MIQVTKNNEEERYEAYKSTNHNRVPVSEMSREGLFGVTLCVVCFVRTNIRRKRKKKQYCVEKRNVTYEYV